MRDTVVDTDLQLLIPDEYVSSLTERLLLYRELDNIVKEEDLTSFENGLRDRFGPLPAEATELINVVRLRWKAMHLGFEKLTLKNKKMLAYFLNKQQSDYFSSPIFQASLLYAQKYPSLCVLKEQNNKLYLTIEGVDSVQRATEVMEGIKQFVPIETVEP